MGRNTAIMNSWKDRDRLRKKYQKIRDEAYREVNECSGIDPKYQQRQQVVFGLDLILEKLK